jgi:CubicO group peptidase (beta-lactamase class C family)
MAMIEVTSPETVGLSAARLGYISDHFNRYVDDGKIPGYLVLIARRGKVAYLHRYGFRDVEASLPVDEHTICRIYSMTKPITTIGVLMLYERGLLQLDDPVSEFIPAFKHLEVFESGDAENYQTVPAEREVTIRDLLTHTAGFTYGFMHAHPVDAMYRQRNIDGDINMSLQAMVGHLSELPLLFSPGTRWSYSHATDILGYLIQEISGKALDHYFAEQILEPLGMTDTAFTVSADKVDRFAAGYERDGDGFRLVDKPGESLYLKQAKLLAGGGGLVSTGHDYLRFSQMLLNKGQLDGVHLLGRKTVELMTSNHLPQNGDLTSMGYTSYSDTRRDGLGIGSFGARFNLRLGGVRTETRADGFGFGFGGSVLLNPAAAHILGSPGEYAWGGLASTAFWVDPVEEMTVIFLTQLRPSWSYPIRRELRVLTYQAIVD